MADCCHQFVLLEKVLRDIQYTLMFPQLRRCLAARQEKHFIVGRIGLLDRKVCRDLHAVLAGDWARLQRGDIGSHPSR